MANITNVNPDILDTLKIKAYNGDFYWRARDIQFLLEDCTWKKLNHAILTIEKGCRKQNLDTSKEIVRTKTSINDGISEYLADDFYLSNLVAYQLFRQFNNKAYKFNSFRKKKKFIKDNKPTLQLYIISLLLSFFIVALITVFSIFYIPLKPLLYFRDLYIATAMNTYTHQWMAKMFFSEETIAEVKANIPEDFTQNTIPQNFYVPKEVNTIETFNISGSTYSGKLIKISNPEKVRIALSSSFGTKGEFLEDIISKNNAVAGMNASGFVDYNGKGNAAYPVGLIIKSGKIIYDPGYSQYDIVGFDESNNLIVGTYAKEELLNNNIRDAIEPFYKLIMNGEERIKAGNGGVGLHPRTAIGQTKSGAVLMLVIDGRQTHSIGATMKDCQDILRSYGAINAAALDGGSSSIMYFDGKIQTKPSNFTTYGRLLPSAFVVYQ